MPLQLIWLPEMLTVCTLAPSSGRNHTVAINVPLVLLVWPEVMFVKENQEMYIKLLVEYWSGGNALPVKTPITVEDCSDESYIVMLLLLLLLPFAGSRFISVKCTTTPYPLGAANIHSH